MESIREQLLLWRYEVGNVTGAASQARVTGDKQMVWWRWGYCSVDLVFTAAVVLTCMRSNPWTATRNPTLTRNITTAFSGAVTALYR
ncbi:hypothetical protein [Klebsiella quasipneumoniae]|uniref:hypothetical protein n=1 Tax=Klebsiella quasipneumoniae TaxID=1463165 RepID=UPI00389098E6